MAFIAARAEIEHDSVGHLPASPAVRLRLAAQRGPRVDRSIDRRRADARGRIRIAAVIAEEVVESAEGHFVLPFFSPLRPGPVAGDPDFAAFFAALAAFSASFALSTETSSTASEGVFDPTSKQEEKSASSSARCFAYLKRGIKQQPFSNRPETKATVWERVRESLRILR